MPMPMMPPPPASFGSAGGPPPPQAGGMMSGPSAQGQDPMQAQPTGQEQASDPKVIITMVFKKFLDIIDAVNTQFPGGEDSISQGMQQIASGFQEKIQQMGSPEPPGPGIPA